MKLVQALVCCAMIGSAQCAEIKSTAVPDAVKATLATSYPEAKNVEWERRGNNFEVDFHANATGMSLFLDSMGNVLQKETQIAPSELPASVRERLAVEYAGRTIEEAERVERDGKTSYEVEMTMDLEVRLNETGVLIEEDDEEDADKDDDEDEDADDDDEDDDGGNMEDDDD